LTGDDCVRLVDEVRSVIASGLPQA
jgi:hypothetical protein